MTPESSKTWREEHDSGGRAQKLAAIGLLDALSPFWTRRHSNLALVDHHAHVTRDREIQ